VHNKTWQDPKVLTALDNNDKLWEIHMDAKNDVIKQVSLLNGVQLNPDILTIGFARRASNYKRGDLIFRNKKLIEQLIWDNKLQIIFSGKAHPNDIDGKKIVSNLYDMSKRYPDNVVFLQNYDMKIAKLLTRGVDVWLNNPIRPMEASGTSGMKAAMNGILNFSILDGWWPEGCEHGINGWQIGGGQQSEDQDQVDAQSLYKTLLNEIIPTYYDNRTKWINMMRASILMSQVQFSSDRMVNEYYKLMYCR